MSGTISNIVDATTFASPSLPIGVNVVGSAVTLAITKNPTTSLLVGLGLGTAFKLFEDEEVTPDPNPDGADNTDSVDDGQSADTGPVMQNGINITNVLNDAIEIPFVDTSVAQSGPLIKVLVDGESYGSYESVPTAQGERYKLELSGGLATSVDASDPAAAGFASVGDLIKAIANNEVSYGFDGNGQAPTYMVNRTPDGGTDPVEVQAPATEFAYLQSWTDLMLREIGILAYETSEDVGPFNSYASLAVSYANNARIRELFDNSPVPDAFWNVEHFVYGEAQQSELPPS